MKLQDLLQQLVTAFRSRKDRQITLVLGDDMPPMNIDVKLQFHRIAQEALHNIVKHTQQGEVIIRLYLKDNQIILLFEDMGEGFDTHAKNSTGYGLTTMRERAQKMVLS